MTRRLAEVARKVGVSEATVSRVLNGKPGVVGVDPPGGPHRARRPRLRAADQAARRARPTRRPGPARAAEPDLPGLRRGHRRRPRPARASRRSCAPRPPAACPRPTTSSCCSSSRSRASSSPAACTRRRTRRTATTRVSPSAGCRRSSSTPRSTASGSRASRATTRSPSSRRWATSSRSATRGSACSPVPPTTCRRNRKLAAAQVVAEQGGHPASARTRSPTRWYSLEAAQAGAARLIDAGVTGHRVRQRPDGAGRDPRGASGPGAACPATSRSSASTTRS